MTSPRRRAAGDVVVKETALPLHALSFPSMIISDFQMFTPPSSIQAVNPSQTARVRARSAGEIPDKRPSLVRVSIRRQFASNKD